LAYHEQQWQRLLLGGGDGGSSSASSSSSDNGSGSLHWVSCRLRFGQWNPLCDFVSLSK
jgi:hypothetical protein